MTLATTVMDADEARRYVDRINERMENMRQLITELHERRGWAALGYPSWEECVKAEFQRARSTVFAQLQAATIERELNSLDVETSGVSTSNLRELATLPVAEQVAVARTVNLATIPTRQLRREIAERRLTRVRDRRQHLIDVGSKLVDERTIARGVIYQADASYLHQIAPTPYKDVDLIVTSPPYGLDVEGSDDGLEGWDDYLDKAEAWAQALYGVLHPEHGRLCLNVPLDKSKGSREPVYADWVVLLQEAGFTYESTIIWKEGNVSNHQARGSVASPNAPHAVAPVETVIVMYRGQWNRNEPRRSSDITELDWVDWLSTTWEFAGEHRHRVGHLAPFPLELPRRLVQLFSFPGDLVGDPFLGSGTSAVAALRLGRRFVGSDIDPDNVTLSRARVAREV